MREYEGINAHINMTAVISFLRTSSETKVATANVLAAWLDINPYIPPLYPLTTCTIYIISGSCAGRKRMKYGLQKPEENWSARVMLKAIMASISSP